MAAAVDPGLGGRPGTSAVPLLDPSDCHILVVDDERISQVVVSNLLRKCNYKVTVAQSGSEAMRVLASSGPGTFQLVLTDLVMPNHSGLDLLRFVRSHQELRNLPVVMMSANHQHECISECISSGAEDFLVKPVTKKEVQNIWTHVMKRLRPGSAAGDVHLAFDPSLFVGQAMGGAGGGGLPRHLPAFMPRDEGTRMAMEAGIALGNPLTGTGGDLDLTSGANGGAISGFGDAPGSVMMPAPWNGSEMVAESTPPAGAAARAAAAAAAAGRGGALGAQQRAAAEALALSVGGARSKRARGGAGGGSSSSMSLLQWLQRPSRVVAPKESFWVFCELLLLMEDQARAGRGEFVRLRPSRLLLHSSGRVTLVSEAAGAQRAMGHPRAQAQAQAQQQAQQRASAVGSGALALRRTASDASTAATGAAAPAAAAAAAAASPAPSAVPAPTAAPLPPRGPGESGGSAASARFTLPDEDQLYGSPEELAGRAQECDARSDSFSLGILFLELFHRADGGEAGRLRLLQEARHRILPPAFVAAAPREAALVTALTHPEAAQRPSAAELLASDMFRDASSMLRTRHRSLADADAQADSQVLLEFLRMIETRKVGAKERAQQQLAQLQADAQAVDAALAEARKRRKRAAHVVQY
ncbi:hypothetical protein FOA52_005211 [Chlamydomonas sp. UWO 241]|nr:hypothetical protein FOA52_005211 [Chlamydomonas sp. UWO 241]